MRLFETSGEKMNENETRLKVSDSIGHLNSPRHYIVVTKPSKDCNADMRVSCDHPDRYGYDRNGDWSVSCS